jgi:hypothetical protein
MGGAAALLFGVAAAGMFRADKPVTIFSDDTEMKSVTGKLVQIAVAAPPKQEVKPADGKLPTMPENLGETPIFNPATAPPPVIHRPAPPPAVATEDEVKAAPEAARSPPRWRAAEVYDEAEDAPYRARPANRRAVRLPPAYDDEGDYDEPPRYDDRYAARDRRTADRRDYVERYYEPPPYRAYGGGW